MFKGYPEERNTVCSKPIQILMLGRMCGGQTATCELSWVSLGSHRFASNHNAPSGSIGEIFLSATKNANEMNESGHKLNWDRKRFIPSHCITMVISPALITKAGNSSAMFTLPNSTFNFQFNSHCCNKLGTKPLELESL